MLTSVRMLWKKRYKNTALSFQPGEGVDFRVMAM